MKKFSALRSKMSPEAQQRSRAKTQEMIRGLALDELRAARQLTQKQLAESLHVNQAAISKLERRADMYLSTLRNVIAAMGGKLEIYASFPDGRVAIEHFQEDKAESIDR